jgi:hypothetical protein
MYSTSAFQYPSTFRKAGIFLIDDEVRDIPRSRVFDPMKHSFNPLKGIEYKRARELAEPFYTISPQGDNTLTVRNGKRAMLRALMKADRLDHVKGDEEVSALIDDFLVSPVLRRVALQSDELLVQPELRHSGADRSGRAGGL